MTAAEKDAVFLHLNPKPRWLSRFAAIILPDKAIAEGRQHLEADYRGETAEVMVVEVERYAIGEEASDEGPIYFFELGQNQLLLLWGQWLCDPHVVTSEALDIEKLWERKEWFRRFEFVRAPASGLVLSIKAIGTETVPCERTVECDQGLPPEPSKIMEGTFATMLGETQPHRAD
jgi:hypothetical protein